MNAGLGGYGCWSSTYNFAWEYFWLITVNTKSPMFKFKHGA